MKKIVLIGAGNVGFHIGKSLLASQNSYLNTSYSLIQVVDTHVQKREKFLEISTVSILSDIDTSADIYILAVKDKQIENVAKELRALPKFPQKALILHVSGSEPITALSNYFERCGVFYFLQTFSWNIPLSLQDTPLCIEAIHSSDQDLLLDLGAILCKPVVIVDSMQRQKIHLAAVFACNFSNLMYSIAYRYLKEEDLDYSLLKTLILQTAQKGIENIPSEVQTGPAVRGDEETIKKHFELLRDNINCGGNKNGLADIYEILTKEIKKEHGQL